MTSVGLIADGGIWSVITFYLLVLLLVAFCAGAVLADRFGTSVTTYRRWYLMCRDVLEEIDDPRARKVLDYIGARTSPKEPWELERGWEK